MLHAPHETIVAEYLSEFLEEERDVSPPRDLDEFVALRTCPTTQTSSSPRYKRISLTLSGYRPRLRRSTQRSRGA